jgi:hypothetical protein
MRSDRRRSARAPALAALGLALASGVAAAGSDYPQDTQYAEWLHRRPSNRAAAKVVAVPAAYTYTYYRYGGRTYYRAYPVAVRPATVASSRGFRLFPWRRR